MILLTIIIVILLINIISSLINLQGNWKTTDAFEEKGTEIYLNINGYAKKNCRFILNQGDESVILDGDMIFINYNPMALFLLGCSGYVCCSGFDDVYPKYIKFHYTPGYLKLYKDVVYGEFQKYAD